jgi:hypothetical protein
MNGRMGVDCPPGPSDIYAEDDSRNIFNLHNGTLTFEVCPQTSWVLLGEGSNLFYELASE